MLRCRTGEARNCWEEADQFYERTGITELLWLLVLLWFWFVWSLKWKQTRGFMWLKSHLSNDVLISVSCLWLRVFNSFPTPLLVSCCFYQTQVPTYTHSMELNLEWDGEGQRRMDNDVNVTQMKWALLGAACSRVTNLKKLYPIWLEEALESIVGLFL